MVYFISTNIELWRRYNLSDFSLSVNHVSKKFKIHHEKRTSIYEEISSLFTRKNHSEVLQVLDDVTFDVKKGEMLGIIGRNGGGKTTLLRIISRIFRPDSGSVYINGTVIPVLALGLGFHPELTATANVIQSSILFGFSKKKISERVDDVIKFAGLEKFADIKTKNFSTGMEMRLAFSTAVQVDPDVLLLDEIFAVGDVDFQKKCYDTMLSFKKKGKSIIFVSHDMNSIIKHCDRALFLNKGKVEMIGDPKSTTTSYLEYMKNHQDEVQKI